MAAARRQRAAGASAGDKMARSARVISQAAEEEECRQEESYRKAWRISGAAANQRGVKASAAKWI